MERRSEWARLPFFLGILSSISLAIAPSAQTVLSEQKITPGFSTFTLFGSSVAAIGDLDLDGNPDLAVGAQALKSAFIVFLHADGTVKSMRRIAEGLSGFGGVLAPEGDFGNSIACLGDLDGDGNPDIAVGEYLDAEPSLGAVWILFLETDGTVKHEQKIGPAVGGFGGVIHTNDDFGSSLASLGDLDGDGSHELAVGAQGDGARNRGAVWILSLDSDGTVEREQKITENVGGFGGDLGAEDRFGNSTASLGDLDGNGVGDLAVGAWRDRDGGTAGAFWILFLEPDGTVESWKKISATAGGFEGHLDREDAFGISVAALGDMDQDGIGDLAVGAQWDDDGGRDRGAVWILLMNADATVKSEHKISETAGGFSGNLDQNDFFGRAITPLGDFDGNGTPDIAVGAMGDDFSTNDQCGAVWLLFLEGPPCFTLDFETEDDFATPLGNGQSISTPPEFGDLVRISGTGANAGPAIFDSTPGGPNDPALNDDMLIGHGNLLLLEDDWYAFAQTVPGFFDVVTDDPHGGDLVFEFPTPVDPRSIQLADINPPPNQGANVTLFDDEDRTRTYFVEPGWTGTYGNAGPHLLDLVTLDPQPGNGTPHFATASQSEGFEQNSVVKLVVHLTGPGAVDELSFCVPAVAQATATVRNGSGGNPMILSSNSMPVLGQTWNATLDCSGTGSSVAVLELRELATSGELTHSGEVLVDGALLHRASRVYTGSASNLAWPIPHDMSLLGLEVHVQGMCLGQGASFRKTRSSGLLSNAIDLVLGF